MSQEQENNASDKTASEMRQGDKVGGVRYVLAISLASALILLFIVMAVVG